MGIKDRCKEVFKRFADAIDVGGRMTLWVVLSIIVLCVIAAWLNPAKIGSYLWVIAKLSLAAVLGYGFDRAASPHGAPRELDGIERAMAQTRRATLMAATIIAAGLMP